MSSKSDLEQEVKELRKIIKEEEILLTNLRFFMYGIVFSLFSSLLAFFIYDFFKAHVYFGGVILSALFTGVCGFLVAREFKKRREHLNTLKLKHYFYKEKLKRVK